MKIEVNIDDRVIAATKRLGPWLLAAAVMSGGAVWASHGTVPNQFKAGDVISASEMNANFAALTDAIESSVPHGAVMFFDSAACPQGWSDYVPANGRYIVGLHESGAPAATVGEALSDQENRPAGEHVHPMQHTHSDSFSLDDPGHTHENPGTQYSSDNGGGRLVHSDLPGGPAPDSYGATTGITLTGAVGDADRETTGKSAGVPGTNAPYVQLKACKKD